MIQDYIKYWATIQKELAQESHDLFLAYLGLEMGVKTPSAGFKSGSEAFPDSEAGFKSGQQLEYRTGRLYRSFNQRGKETETKLNISNDNIELTVGSKVPYAEIHNTGGFIKSKGKMSKYFWYKYITSGNEFFKIMALAVEKNGGVNIKKTNYFDNAVRNFERDGIAKIFRSLIEKMGTYVFRT